MIRFHHNFHDSHLISVWIFSDVKIIIIYFGRNFVVICYYSYVWNASNWFILNSTDGFFWFLNCVAPVRPKKDREMIEREREEIESFDHKSIGNRNEFPTTFEKRAEQRFIADIFAVILMCQMYIIIIRCFVSCVLCCA
jgi:hypothetical protein